VTDWATLVADAVSPQATRRAIALLRACAAIDYPIKRAYRARHGMADATFAQRVNALFGDSDISPRQLIRLWKHRNALLHEGELPAYESLEEGLPDAAKAWHALESPRERHAIEATRNLAHAEVDAYRARFGTESLDLRNVAAVLHLLEGHADETVLALGVCLVAGSFEAELHTALADIGGIDLGRKRRDLLDDAALLGLIEAEPSLKAAMDVRNAVTHNWKWRDRAELEVAIRRLHQAATSLRYGEFPARRQYLKGLGKRFSDYMRELRRLLPGAVSRTNVGAKIAGVITDAFGRLEARIPGLNENLETCQGTPLEIAGLADTQLAATDEFMSALVLKVKRAVGEIQWQAALKKALQRLAAGTQAINDLELDAGAPESAKSWEMNGRAAAYVIGVFGGVIMCFYAGCRSCEAHDGWTSVKIGGAQGAIIALVLALAVYSPTVAVRHFWLALLESRRWRALNERGVEAEEQLRGDAISQLRKFIDIHGDRAREATQAAALALGDAASRYSVNPRLGPRAARHLMFGLVAAYATVIVAFLLYFRPWFAVIQDENGRSPGVIKGSPARQDAPTGRAKQTTPGGLAAFDHYAVYRLVGAEQPHVFCGRRANLASAIPESTWEKTYGVLKGLYEPHLRNREHAFVAYYDEIDNGPHTPTVGVVFAQPEALDDVKAIDGMYQINGTPVRALVKEKERCFASP
jgi:hypothetical protein